MLPAVEVRRAMRLACIEGFKAGAVQGRHRRHHSTNEPNVDIFGAVSSLWQQNSSFSNNGSLSAYANERTVSFPRTWRRQASPLPSRA